VCLYGIYRAFDTLSYIYYYELLVVVLTTCSNRFDKDESGGIKFIRTVGTSDLITMVGEVPQSAIVYEKVEESVFVGWILQESNGRMKVKIKFGSDEETGKDNDDNTYDNTVDFSNEYQFNATYPMKRVYCKNKSKRDIIFSDVSAPDVEKGNLINAINAGKYSFVHCMCKTVFVYKCVFTVQTLTCSFVNSQKWSFKD